MRTIATAGHVDHGKSTLVRALTGTDPDRLAEEQARGLTIDLGFAFAELPSGRRIGFVDVPGHARFLPNMLAGAGAVDLALFVIAADEGWSAQSREHLQILDLLGAAGGVIALTKIDRVEDQQVEAVVDAVRARTHGTVLEDATIVPCDAVHGEGIDILRVALDALLDTVGPPVDRGRPRLWVDRAFSVKGAGTVVTGTLEGGRLENGQSVLVVADDSRSARVRGLESGGRPVDVAEPGSRVAVNLAGVDRAQVARGDVVVLDGQWRPTAVVDGRARLEGPVPTSRAALHVHVGSAKVQGRVHVVDGFARVRLERAVPLVPGDRLILRDPGPSEIVGSIEVLDVEPSARLDPDRLRLPVVEQRFLAQPWQRRDQLGPATGLDATTLDDELRDLEARHVVVERRSRGSCAPTSTSGPSRRSSRRWPNERNHSPTWPPRRGSRATRSRRSPRTSPRSPWTRTWSVTAMRSTLPRRRPDVRCWSCSGPNPSHHPTPGRSSTTPESSPRSCARER